MIFQFQLTGNTRTAAFAELLLKQTPVWEFINGGVPNSTRLLYEKVLREAEDYGV